MQGLKALFDAHPQTDQFFITSDGLAHFTRHEADCQAARLKDQEVQTITRDEVNTALAREAAGVTAPEEVTIATKTYEHQVTEDDLEGNADLKGKVEVGETVTISMVITKTNKPAALAEEQPSEAKQDAATGQEHTE